MVSNLAKLMMGESSGMTGTADVAPVMTGAAVISNPSATSAKRRIPTMKPEKLRKLRNRVVDGLMGVKEDRDGSVIPSDAQEIQTIEQSSHGLNIDTPQIPGQKIRNPYSGEEPLILPAASLVAPDVTPEGIFPLDPAQLPGADQGSEPVEAPLGQPSGAASPAVDLLLGKTNNPATAASPARGSGMPMEPTTGASMSTDRMSTESALARLPGIPAPTASIVESGDTLLGTGTPMPVHESRDISGVMDAFRMFVKPQPVKFNE